MSDKDEKQEQADVEGHAHGVTDEPSAHGLTDDESQAHGMHGVKDDDDTPDVEGHKHSTSPVRKHSTKHST
jgi:hypothetical protein